MKIQSLLILLFFSFQLVYGQDVKISSAVIATAGNDKAETYKAPVNISKWRLGEVYLVTLPQNETLETEENQWKPEVFPNPFTNRLKLAFISDDAGVYTISITDMAGKRTWYTEDKSVLPNQVIELELGKLNPATYLLTILPKNGDKKWITKIQKQ